MAVEQGAVGRRRGRVHCPPGREDRQGVSDQLAVVRARRAGAARAMIASQELGAWEAGVEPVRQLRADAPELVRGTEHRGQPDEVGRLIPVEAASLKNGHFPARRLSRLVEHAGPPDLIALFVSSFKHQHRTDEARDRRDRGAHLEGFVCALEAGHQCPSLLGLLIEEGCQVHRRGVVMGVQVNDFIRQGRNHRRLLSMDIEAGLRVHARERALHLGVSFQGMNQPRHARSMAHGSPLGAPTGLSYEPQSPAWAEGRHPPVPGTASALGRRGAAGTTREDLA
jgi:hypothetical protein